LSSDTYINTRHHNPEDHDDFNLHRRKNLKSSKKGDFGLSLIKEGRNGQE
jgi:hypothetical protein